MKISRNWLQTFFDAPLPDAEALVEALTFHAFEIESIERIGDDDILDVKVTPNRGHDALSHHAIAKELGAILSIPHKSDPLQAVISLEPRTDALKVTIENPELCRRFTAALIQGVRVGPSPDWLRQRLEGIGQRSINNVVDATNFVMFNIGQPLHAFDAGKLSAQSGYFLVVRKAKDKETMLGLDDKEYTLTGAMLAIADGNTGEAVSIAGIKGGKPTGIDAATTDIILEAANWDGVLIRKSSQALKLRADASDRFQQVLSPELAAYGLHAAANLILELAGGAIAGFVDEYPMPQGKREVAVSTKKINHILGTELSVDDVGNALTRLGLSHAQVGDHFTVSVPFERLDITIPEDLIEEVARILGYDKIPAQDLPPFPNAPEVNPNFSAAEELREQLMAKGYSEIFTSVFADKGARAVANKVDSAHPYLRANLTDGAMQALQRNIRNKDLLGLKEVKLFEIGTVWTNNGEEIHVATVGEKEKPEEQVVKPAAGETYSVLPISNAARYQSFSKYPFIVRDIALWVPKGAEPVEVLNVVRAAAGSLLVRSELFDTFEKGDKLSLAFRLVFQSFEKTLTDAEVNAVMEKVNEAVKKEGWEVR